MCYTPARCGNFRGKLMPLVDLPTPPRCIKNATLSDPADITGRHGLEAERFGPVRGPYGAGPWLERPVHAVHGSGRRRVSVYLPCSICVCSLPVFTGVVGVGRLLGVWCLRFGMHGPL